VLILLSVAMPVLLASLVVPVDAIEGIEEPSLETFDEAPSVDIGDDDDDDDDIVMLRAEFIVIDCDEDDDSIELKSVDELD